MLFIQSFLYFVKCSNYAIVLHYTSTLFHFPSQIQVVLVTIACLKNRTYHSIPSFFMLKYMEWLFNFNVYKKKNILQIWRLQQIWRHVYSINHWYSSRHHVYTSCCPNSCHRIHAAENVEWVSFPGNVFHNKLRIERDMYSPFLNFKLNYLYNVVADKCYFYSLLHFLKLSFIWVTTEILQTQKPKERCRNNWG